MTRSILAIGLALVSLALAAPVMSPRLTVRLADAGYVTMASDAGLPAGAVAVDNGGATDCFCSTGGVATVPLLDGGLLTAPKGRTLRSCTGVGCQTKPCSTLFLMDGGVPVDETWPGGCPLQ